ncbi:pyruvate kinase [Tumidithrix elongata RA019]|uniref:Pyruvate kinase n=1 Tax=Tumidithrix elongata BACA0141 TaxID=2716417 RepID=A0AAW9Q0G6_9CYAN|nr:pyruvate kinase [Tumidithrix elongata RA019]
MTVREVFRRTKIVATLGPATSSPEVIRELIEAGASTFRLNFSHGTHADHHRSVCMIRQVSSELNQPVGILQDLQGPKIRLGKFTDGSIYLNKGDLFTLTSRKVPGTQASSSITYENLAREIPPNATIMLDDGKVEMIVESVDLENEDLNCRVVVGGVLSNSKGVNFPNVHLSVKAMTEKDREDLQFGLGEGVDWVALSFVCNPEDILEIKEIIAATGRHVGVIAKIEKHEAIARMEEILSVCDGVMVARGDLGVEVPAEDVPLLQKQLIRTANRLGIPVITATQMLDSMVSNPRPTRAEISDVANAIIDGTDAVMLSNETAVGKYPVQAVETMARIALRIEKEHNLHPVESSGRSVPNAISQAVGRIATQLDAAAILTLTKTGSTARNVSKFRPPIPILAVTPQVDVARQLQLVWGVQPLMVLSLPSARQNFEAALNLAQERRLVEAGDLVVMTAGTLQGVAGSTDLIKVEFVSSVVGKGLSIGQGIVNGRARVAFHYLDVKDFNEGEILVVDRTDADFVDIIRKAAAVITEESSLESHAVVIGRKLGIPVIIGVKNATSNIRDGEPLSINFRKGLIYTGSKSDEIG